MSALVHVITIHLPGRAEEQLRTLVAKRRAATGFPPTSEVRSAVCTELVTQMLQQKSGKQTLEMQVVEELVRQEIEEQGNWTGPATVLQLSVEAKGHLSAIIGEQRRWRASVEHPTKEEKEVALEVERRKGTAAAQLYLRYAADNNIRATQQGVHYYQAKSHVRICTELIAQALRTPQLSDL